MQSKAGKQFRAWRFLLSACFSLALFSACGTSATVSPAEATVTAITTNESLPPGCYIPQATYEIVAPAKAQSVALPTFDQTQITISGTCWIPGRTITVGLIDHVAAGTIMPLSKLTLMSSAQVQADGTFGLTITLLDKMRPYIWSQSLPFVVQLDGFVEFAALSIPVSQG
jgi:hypothetical protein